MKKFYLLITCVFFGYTTSAQNISFGPKAGINVSSLRGEESYDFESKVGWHLGAFVHFPISEWFAVQGEVFYSRQGAKQEITVVNFDNNANLQEEKVMLNVKLDYINIPVLTKFYPTTGLNLFLGPQVGFLVAAHEKVMTGEYKNAENDISKVLRDMDFGLVFGAGYDFDFGLIFQARYYWGLANINKLRLVSDDEVLGHPTLKNAGFQFSLGYRF